MLKYLILACLIVCFVSVGINTHADKERPLNFKKLAKNIKLYSGTKTNICDLEKILLKNHNICKDEKHDFVLNLAKIHVESLFDQKAISCTGAVGLHQISKILAKHKNVSWYKVKTDYVLNSKIGIQFMQELIEKYGVYRGLMAYNNGETGMYSMFANFDYPVDVLKHYSNYEKIVEQSKTK